MLFLVYLSTILLIQATTAQILANGQLGFQNIANLPRTVTAPSSNVLVANNGVSGLGNLAGLTASNVQAARPLSTFAGNNNLVATNLANNNLASGFTNLAGFSNLGSGLAATNSFSNLGVSLNRNAGSNLISVSTPVNLSNGFNINTGRFAVGNTGVANLLPPGKVCGIQILGEGLEVVGSVGVNGQLPFYTNVNVNGQLPTTGAGVVSCSCGQ